LFAVTAPAHAAYVDYIDTTLDLNFGSNQNLTGNLDLQWLPVGFGGAGCCRVIDYIVTDSNLSLNGNPVGAPFNVQNAFPYNGTTVQVFIPNTPPLNFIVLGVNSNYLPPNPTFANFLLNGSHATGGTVRVNSEILATPLPAALPLFGTAIAGLGGAGWWKRRKESRSR
jgi:hypothetical protein